MSNIVVADGRGRLLLPVDTRELLGLKPGTRIAVETNADGSVVLRAAADARFAELAAIRGSVVEGRTVDDLIRERRLDATRESA